MKRSYKIIAEIPEAVDLAVVFVPADRILDLIPQLEAKGIKKRSVNYIGFRRDRHRR